MTFDDPLNQREPEETPAAQPAGDPTQLLQGIASTMEDMFKQLRTLTDDVETLKADRERPQRAALPAVDTSTDVTDRADVGDAGPERSASEPALASTEERGESLRAPAAPGTRLAAAEQARQEAEEAERRAQEARRLAAEAEAEAARVEAELAAAEGKLKEAQEVVSAREAVYERAEESVKEAEEEVTAQAERLKDARIAQVEAQDLLEQARSFRGAEAMVQEAERLFEQKRAEMATLQGEQAERDQARDRALEARDRAQERLVEARHQVEEIEADIRRLREEPVPVEPEPVPMPEPMPSPVEEFEAPEEPEEAAPASDERTAPYAPSLAEEPVAPRPPEETVLAAPEPPMAADLEDEVARQAREAREELEAELEGPVVPADTDEMARQARQARADLEAELRGAAPAPPFFEEDEEARRLAEMTEAEIAGGDLGSLPGTPPLPEPEPMAPEARMPWEDEESAPPAPAPAAAEPMAPDARMPWDEPAEAPLPEVREREPDAPFEASVPQDHVPAYADLEAEGELAPMTPPAYSGEDSSRLPATISTPAGLPEPFDVLYAIAPERQLETGPTAPASARQIVRAAHAPEDAGRKRKGQKPKFEALPFDLLVPRQPMIAAFFSPSGGVGKSSTCLNVAALMAAIGAKQAADSQKRGLGMQMPRVLALDGDVVQGSLALRLTGETKPSMHTLQLYLDAREAQGFVGRERWPQSYQIGSGNPGEEPMQKFVHWPDKLENLNLLAAPDDPDKFYDFGPDEYREILELLGQFYDVILIDCGTEVVMDSNRAWLQHAHSVFMLCTPELDRIWNASKAMGYIAKSRPHPDDRSENPQMLPPLVTREKVSIVMTASDAETGINLTGEELVDEFFPYIDANQRFFIPDVGRELRKANNAHDFLVLNDQRFAKSMMDIAKHVFNRYATSQRSLGVGR